MEQVIGRVERVSRSLISGWAYDGREVDRRVEVALVLNGEVIARALADLRREDLTGIGLGRSDIAFDLPVPSGCILRADDIAVVATGTAEPLPVDEVAFVNEGIVEAFGDYTARGWAWSTGLSKRVTLQLVSQDRVLHRFVADEYREDLLTNGIGDGRHGFSVNFRHLAQGAFDPTQYDIIFEDTQLPLTHLHPRWPVAKKMPLPLRPMRGPGSARDG